MKALVYHGPQDIRYEDFPDARLGGPDHALVRIAKSAICGSDLHIYHGEYHTRETGFVVGHECIGEILEVGSEVRRFKPGDIVLSAPGMGCTDCPECLKGMVGCCKKNQPRCYGQGPFLGSLQGVQTELISVPAADTTLLHIPQGITDDQAILLTDNLPTAYFGARNADIRPGCSVAVIGVGPIGLSSVECAFILGAARVFVIDRVPERLAYAASLGAIPVTGDNVQEQIISANHGEQVDAVVDTVGKEDTLNLSLRLPRVRGVVSEIGAFLSNRVPFPMALVQSRSVTFRIGLCSVQAQWPDLIPLVQAGRIRGEHVISHHVGLSEGSQAYRLFASRKDGVMKIVMDARR